MSVKTDEETYALIAREFMVDLAKRIITPLHKSKKININKLSQEDDKLLYSLVFNMGVMLENHGGVNVGEKTYFTHAHFSEKLRSPDNYITSEKRTLLHGFEDDIIKEAVEQVRNR